VDFFFRSVMSFKDVAFLAQLGISVPIVSILFASYCNLVGHDMKQLLVFLIYIIIAGLA